MTCVTKAFDKYEKDGDYHWKQWEGKTHHYYHHAEFCKTWVRGRPCLDIGCGDGLITHLLGPCVIGVDNVPLAVQLARKHGVNAFVGDAYNLPKLKFKSVLLADVIEHLSSPTTALLQVHEVLEPDGILYLTTPPQFPTLSDYHFKEYNPDEIKSLVESCGFALTEPIVLIPERLEQYAKFRKVSR